MKKLVFAIAIAICAGVAAMFCLCPVFLGKVLLYGSVVLCFILWFAFISYCLAAIFCKNPEKKNLKK